MIPSLPSRLLCTATRQDLDKSKEIICRVITQMKLNLSDFICTYHIAMLPLFHPSEGEQSTWRKEIALFERSEFAISLHNAGATLPNAPRVVAV